MSYEENNESFFLMYYITYLHRATTGIHNTDANTKTVIKTTAQTGQGRRSVSPRVPTHAG